MDTRDKIIERPELAAGAAVVTGYFDVLTPWHIAEIGAAKEGAPHLAAIVLPLSEGLLSQRARAELAASLRVIDYVIIHDGPVESLLAQLAPTRVVRLEDPDLRRRGELIQHVRERQIR